MIHKAAAALLVFGLMQIVRAGPLDAALNWARADKLPIEIDVNLPWLPCKLQIALIHCIHSLLGYVPGTTTNVYHVRPVHNIHIS